METYQIKVILDELGYSMNTPIPMNEINAIVLEGNMNLYPDPLTRFIFKSYENIGLLLAFSGKYDTDDNFIQDKKPLYAVPFDQIEGFQLVNKYRPYAPFRFGRSM